MTQRSSHSRVSSSVSDDWQEGTVVAAFSADGGSSGDLLAQQQEQQQEAAAGQGRRQSLPDWDNWDTGEQGGGPSSSSPSSMAAASAVSPSSSSRQARSPLSPRPSGMQSSADDDFFAALERASNSPRSRNEGNGNGHRVAQYPSPRRPSPPMIDLRPEERRIRERERVKAAQQQQGSASEPSASQQEEEDWFAAFERDPAGQVNRPSSSSRPGIQGHQMNGDQLESMTDARESPMIVLPPNQPDYTVSADYFGPASVSRPPSRVQKQAKPAPQRAGSDSWWGSIRGLGSNLAHRAVDLMDPGVDFGDEELKIARKMGAIDINSKESTPVPSRGVTPAPPNTMPASSSLGSQVTTAAQSIPSAHARKNSVHSHSPVKSTSLFVSGAPGVDFNNLNNHWNRGSWSLDDDAALRSQPTNKTVADAEATKKAPKKMFRDPLPVSLAGRREETSPVISGFHSSHIQPYLPPRLKLGRTWRLLYSSDQDGVSLKTLYYKVKTGLDPKSASVRSPGYVQRFESDRNDSWLRGSSAAARAAVGSDLYNASSDAQSSLRLGSGLASISDAGLVLAIRDSEDRVFGAYSNEGFKNFKGYYGNGDCFLWRSVTPRAGGTPYIHVYPSTLMNSYHVQSTDEYLSLGGGVDGRYGIWIDEAFEKGVSGMCETFQNDVLCDETERSRSSTGEERGKDTGVEEQEVKARQRERQRGEVKFEPVFVEVWAVGLD